MISIKRCNSNGLHPRMLAAWLLVTIRGLVSCSNWYRGSSSSLETIKWAEFALIWCVCPSNSRLQTRCSWATGRIIRLETWGGELFVISRVYRSMLFSFNLLTIAISSQLQCGFVCTLSFLLSSFGGFTRLVYLQMSGFPSFPQFWLLRCSREGWVILLQ